MFVRSSKWSGQSRAPAPFTGARAPPTLRAVGVSVQPPRKVMCAVCLVQRRLVAVSLAISSTEAAPGLHGFAAPDPGPGFRRPDGVCWVQEIIARVSFYSGPGVSRTCPLS